MVTEPNHKERSASAPARAEGFAAWFEAHDAYHKASDIYNARVRFIREQEAAGKVGEFNAHGEYKALNEAQRAALAQDEIFYRAVLVSLAAPACPLGQGASLTYPAEMTPALQEVLGLMVFTTGPIAHGFRDAGADIPRSVEAEQAFVLHWLIRLALEHGAEWRKIAADKIGEVIIEARSKDQNS